MKDGLRSFIAVDMPSDAVLYIEKIQSILKPTFPMFRWVAPHNIHLTLHFLGDKTKDELDEIVKRCLPLFTDPQVINLTSGELGVFPNWQKPAVLWLSLQGELDQIRIIHKKSQEILSALGYTVDRKPFTPHITLARIPRNEKGLFRNIKIIKDFDCGKRTGFTINSITLYTSTLRHQGPIYKPYFRFFLKNHN